ncbi:MAG: hypothetical protein HYY20_01740, partial [Candidatus Tectomicrobia bacterium]|nr:hypothetical protein [Candidatus Tectomicrobia bacterium]
MADNLLQTCHAIAERAIQYAREVSFPRQVGTEGEEKTQAYLLEKIAALGWQARSEAFAYRPGFDTLVKGEIGVVLLADTVLAWA